MSVESAVLAGQRKAESLMCDRVRIVRHSVVSDADGVESFSQAEVWSGRCKVATYEPFESNRDIAGAPVVEQRYMLHLPVRAVGSVQVGDFAHVEGRSRPLKIASLLDKTFQTALRCACDEVTTEA